jgi:hypothetical protein
MFAEFLDELFTCKGKCFSSFINASLPLCPCSLLAFNYLKQKTRCFLQLFQLSTAPNKDLKASGTLHSLVMTSFLIGKTEEIFYIHVKQELLPCRNKLLLDTVGKQPGCVNVSRHKGLGKCNRQTCNGWDKWEEAKADTWPSPGIVEGEMLRNESTTYALEQQPGATALGFNSNLVCLPGRSNLDLTYSSAQRKCWSSLAAFSGLFNSGMLWLTSLLFPDLSSLF